MQKYIYLILLYKSTVFLPPSAGAIPEKDFDMYLNLKYGFPKHERSFGLKTDLKHVRMGKIS